MEKLGTIRLSNGSESDTAVASFQPVGREECAKVLATKQPPEITGSEGESTQSPSTYDIFWEEFCKDAHEDVDEAWASDSSSSSRQGSVRGNLRRGLTHITEVIDVTDVSEYGVGYSLSENGTG